MTSERPRARRPRLLAALAAAGLALGACGGEHEEAAAPSTPAPEAPAAAPSEPEARLVRTVAPEEGTLTATRSSSATIRPVRDANVSSGANGRVVEILARPGDVVAAGDPVIRLDDTQAALQLRNAELAVRQAQVDLESARRSSDEGAGQAQASLRAAEASAANLRDQVEDLRALVEAGGAARSELRSLEVQLEQAESNAQAARDAVARAGRSEGEDLALLELRLETARVGAEQARASLDETTIVAPFDGEIVELNVETGEFAATGSPAFRIQSADEREATVDLPPEDALRLQERGEVTLRYAGRDLVGRVAGSSRPSQQPRSVRLTIRLEGDGVENVPSGAIADLRYTVELAEGLLLPSSAVAAEGGDTFVYVARDGVATRVPVDVRGEASGTAAVAGLAPDADVISPRPLDVREGTAVRTAGG